MPQRLLVLLGTLLLTPVAQAEPTPEQIKFFETNIRPLLAEHCYRCHGSTKQKADLRLDTRADLLRGSSAGKVVFPGRPEASLLIKAVRHDDEAAKMPPDKKLSDRQIEDLKRWVRMGVPYPADTSAIKRDDGKTFWAFQSPVDPPLPRVRNAGWVQSPLDRFVLARLESKKLKPAAPAERRALIRRATFDLTGLPPTPEEVEAFVADTSSNAFAKVVDRLLASPHYGERWGRHWLDVVRYADSNGLDENVAFGNAWRYRDYVVQAFNEDRPYDEFLLEQLAGDLLPESDPATRRRRLIATGFLALGPKVLAEVDEKKMELDIIDEQVDTVGRTFMALTLGCARCHDHKFDPLTAHDYHGLAGIFKSTKTMEHFRKIARWHENSLASPEETKIKADLEREVAKLKESIKKVSAKTDADAKLEAKRLREELARLEKKVPELPSAMGVAEGGIVDVPIYIRGNHLKPGNIVPRHVPVVLAGPEPPTFEPKRSGRLELAHWLVRPEHPLTARVMANRIWRWHFGQGIVRSADNFGRLGDLPDNPQLLDWLAHRFIENKWSVKAMHRLILLSSTYQMSSANNARAVDVDPGNRLLWRFPIRRLEAEEIRDALLAVTGQLDRTTGGSLLHVKNRAYLFDHTSKDGTRYDSRRRSLYLPVIRNNVYDVFQLFDFPDPAVPTGDRSSTTVAPQALLFLNSDWMMDLCDRLAAELSKESDDAGRIQELYRRAYGRPATPQDVARTTALVGVLDKTLASRAPDAGKRRSLAWSSVCQTLLSANEFVYVE